MRKKLRTLVIPTSVVVLAAIVALLGRNLWLDLRALSVAGRENAQWTILQLDTEFANLQSALLEQASSPSFDQLSARTRIEIALSRVDLVSQGNAYEIIASDGRASDLLARLLEFTEEISALAQGEFSEEVTGRLIELTALSKTTARELALRGIEIGAKRTEAQRQAFSTKLQNTGIVAIAVIGALGAVLLFLDRLLWVAKNRDIALRETTARLASTVSASLDAIVLGDARGEIIEFNEAAERILGWKKDEVIGKKLEEVILANHSLGELNGNVSLNLMPWQSTPAEAIRMEIMGVRRSGEMFPAELSVATVSSTEGNLVAIYLRDISVRKLNEKALLDAKERAERTDRAKSQFLAIMSHEMRTPLNGILGVLDLLRTTALSNTQERYLDVATGSGEIMLEQINEALDVARIESGSLVLSPKVFNLSDKIRSVAGILEPLASEKNLDLIVRLDPDMSTNFVADVGRIGQIVTNLLGNAIKFTSEGNVTIELTGTSSDQFTSATIAVSDTGPGIPEDRIEAVFEDYVTLNRSEGRLSRGDGLGLSISRRIARLMGGDITVESRQGIGSRFTLTLPLKKATQPVLLGESNVADEGQQLSPGRQNLNVLIVEDNPINHSLLCEMLQSMGHSVQGATSAEKGYSLAMQIRFDLILMDVGLPDFDGLELTSRIRETEGPNKYTRIHGVTAFGEEEYLERAIASGMDGFSTKPIRMHTLRKVLQGESLQSKVIDPGARHSDIDIGIDIDIDVLNELRETIGQKRTSEAVGEFFSEMSELFNYCNVEPTTINYDEMELRLHKLRGASALFGLRVLTEVIEKTRTEAEMENSESFPPSLSSLETLTEDVKMKVHKLISSSTRTL